MYKHPQHHSFNISAETDTDTSNDYARELTNINRGYCYNYRVRFTHAQYQTFHCYFLRIFWGESQNLSLV